MLKTRSAHTMLLRYAPVFAVFAVMFVYTLLTPLIADDFNYAFNWATGERLRSVWELSGSMYSHRLYTNGRVFAHGFVQLFSLLPRAWFALANAAVAAGQALLLQRFLQGQDGPRPVLLCMALGLIWVCMPAFGQVYFWADGACSYSWGLFFALVLVWPFFRAAEAPAADSGRLTPGKLLYLPLAFVAGAWSEHISFAALAACFFLFLLCWIRNRRFPVYLFSLLLCGGAGYLYLMFSPSMLGGKKHERGALSLSVLTSVLERVDARLPGGLLPWALLLAAGLVVLLLLGKRFGAGMLLRLVSAAMAAAFLLAACFFALKAARADGLMGLAASSPLALALAMVCFFLPLTAALFHKLPLRELLVPVLLFFSGLCVLPLFAFASYFPARGCAVMALFSVLGGVLILGRLDERRVLRPAAAAAAVLFLLFFVLGSADIIAVHRSDLQRQALIRQALAGDGIVVTDRYPDRTRYSAQYGLADLTADGTWPSDQMALYYGLDRIICPED